MKKSIKPWLVWALVAIMLAFMYLPMLILIVFSFTEAKVMGVWSGFSLNLYAALISNAKMMNALGNSLLLAFISGIIATVLGTSAAIGIYYMKKLVKPTAEFLSNITVENAEIVTGVAFMIFFLAVRLPYGWVTLIIAHTMITAPYVVLSVLPKLSQLNPNLYEAGLDLGASPVRSMLTVIVPQLIPGMISGFIMAFTLSLDDFVVSKFVYGNVETIPVYLYSQLRRGPNPALRAMSSAIFIAVLSALIAFNVISMRRRKKQLANCKK